MQEYFDYLIALALGSFGDVRDDFETVDLKKISPKLVLTNEGFEMVFEANDAEWRICLSEKHGLVYIDIYVPYTYVAYTAKTIPCKYSKEVHFHHATEARVMFNKIVDHLLAA